MELEQIYFTKQTTNGPLLWKKRSHLLSKIKKQFKRALPEDIKTMITYKSTKLSTKKFPTVYRNKCLDEGCKDNFIGKTNSSIVERMKYHNIRCKNRAGSSGAHEGLPLYSL